MEWNRACLAQLEAIDPARLDTANAVDHAILKNSLEFSIWSAEQLREHEWNPMRYGVGDALYSLVAREFAPLEERLATLNERLQGVPAVLAAARENLKDPPQVHTETAIRQNDGVISMLRSELDEFLALAPQMKAPMATARAEAIEALEQYGEWLREDLLPRSNRSFRIGEPKYRTKLAYTLHSDLSMAEILERAQHRLAELQDELYETALRCSAKATQARATLQLPTARRSSGPFWTKLADSHPTDDSIVDDARKALARGRGVHAGSARSCRSQTSRSRSS